MLELAFLASQPGVTRDDIDDSYSGFGTGAGAPALGGKLVNRGHLAMKAQAQRIGWRQACNTHVFVNAVPQQKEFNQGDWLDLEAYSGAAANKFGRVWVIAGPVWHNGQSIGTIGHSDTIPVAVPQTAPELLHTPRAFSLDFPLLPAAGLANRLGSVFDGDAEVLPHQDPNLIMAGRL